MPMPFEPVFAMAFLSSHYHHNFHRIYLLFLSVFFRYSNNNYPGSLISFVEIHIF